MAAFQQKNKSGNWLNLWLNRHYRLGAAALLGAVIAAGVFFLIYPKYRFIKELARTSLPGKLEEFKALEDYAAKIKELEQAIVDWQNKNQANVKKLEQALPDEPKIPELIAQLDALTKDSGFLLNSLDFSEVTAVQEQGPAVTARDKARADKNMALVNWQLDKNIKQLNVSLNLTGGDYLAFKKFLDKLEKNMRLFDVISIKFASSLTEGTDYNLALRTYYLASTAQ